MNLSFPNPNPAVLVVGDIMIDHYLWGNCDRISPEAPVQVVDIVRDSSILGGGGNVIQNLLAFGARVDIASVIGQDDAGDELLQMLRQIGTGVKMLVRQSGRKSSKKTRIVAANQQVVRYDVESKEPISPESEEQLKALLLGDMEGYDVVLVSDYGKGVLTPSLTQYVIRTAQAKGLKVLIDPKGADYTKYAGAYLITPNRKEAGLATKKAVQTAVGLEEAGFQLKRDLGLAHAIITLSEDGIALFGEQMHHIPTRARDVFDVTGAGDTVLASLGFALANNLDIVEACHFANYAAGIVVGKVGSATATLAEIEEYANTFVQQGSHLFIKTEASMVPIAVRLRQEGKRLVLLEGTLGPIRLADVKTLEQAKSQGDILIVALATASEEPRETLEEQAYILAALKVVDYVLLYPAGSWPGLITALQPEVVLPATTA